MIEVADVARRRDQGPKLRRSERGGISENWMIDVSAGCAYVYAQPQADGRFLTQRLVEADEPHVFSMDVASLSVVLGDLFAE